MAKLLQINSCLGILSTGKIADKIAETAMAHGWECYCVHGARYTGKSIQRHYQTSSLLEEILHFAKSLLLDAHGLGSVFATKRAIKIIKKIRPDIIQIHCIHGYYINYKYLFKYLNATDIPIVWTFHDCWAYTGHCPHFISADCYKWKKGCEHCPLTGSYPQSLIDRSKKNYLLKKKIFSNSPNLHIVTISEWSKQQVKESFLKEKAIRKISNGIDMDIFKPTAAIDIPLILQDKFVILGVASQWAIGKGMSDFIKLSELLQSDEQIVLVGISEKIKANLPSNILGIPLISDQKKLASMYSRANVVVSLSPAETFGLSVVEGMACGTPCVVYNNSAQPESIIDGIGYIAENGNIKNVYEKIQLIKHTGKSHYSDLCRNHVKQLYNSDEMSSEYFHLYESIISHNPYY